MATSRKETVNGRVCGSLAGYRARRRGLLVYDTYFFHGRTKEAVD